MPPKVAAENAAACAAAVAAEADAVVSREAAPLVTKAVKSAARGLSFNHGPSFNEGPSGSSSFSSPPQAPASSSAARGNSSNSRSRPFSRVSPQAPAVFRSTTAAHATERRRAEQGSRARGEAIKRTSELLGRVGQRGRGQSSFNHGDEDDPFADDWAMKRAGGVGF